MILFTFYSISGANPHLLIRTAKAKTVQLKMLLTRKNKHKRKLDTAASNNSETETEKSMTPPYKRKGLSESEKLIRDTLLHESKTMKPEKTCLNKINGIFECYENSLLNNNNNINSNTKPINNKKIYGRRSLSDGYYNHNVERGSELVICEIDKGYMTITLNNIRRHNVLTIEVGFL